MVATGLFTSPGRLLDAFDTDTHVGFFYEVGRGSVDATLLGNQVLATVLIISWVTTTMLPFFLWLNFMGWFRSGSLEELVGLDHSHMRDRPTYLEEEGDGFSDEIGDDREPSKTGLPTTMSTGESYEDKQLTAIQG